MLICKKIKEIFIGKLKNLGKFYSALQKEKIQTFQGQSFNFILILYFILISIALLMGAEESINQPQQSPFQNIPKSNQHSQNTLSSSFQFSSTYKRKIKIFEKNEKPQPFTSSISAGLTQIHTNGRMGQQQNVYNLQKTNKIQGFQNKLTISGLDFKERENLLVSQRIKLQKVIKQDLQNYLLSDPPSKKCTLNPQKTQEERINTQQKTQYAQLTQQILPKTLHHVSSNNSPHILQTAFNKNNHLSPNLEAINRKLTRQLNGSPNQMQGMASSQTTPSVQQNNQKLKIINQPQQKLIKIQGPLRSRIQQQYEIVVNSINSQQKRQIVNSIPKNSLLMWKMKERLESAVSSEDEGGVYKIKRSLVSMVESENGSGQEMLKIQDRLVSAVQTEDAAILFKQQIDKFGKK